MSRSKKLSNTVGAINARNRRARLKRFNALRDNIAALPKMPAKRITSRDETRAAAKFRRENTGRSVPLVSFSAGPPEQTLTEQVEALAKNVATEAAKTAPASAWDADAYRLENYDKAAAPELPAGNYRARLGDDGIRLFNFDDQTKVWRELPSEHTPDHVRQMFGIDVRKTEYKFDGPHPELLVRFDTPRSAPAQMTVSIDIPEFTTLCPVTGQPDYAKLSILYTPHKFCVESKSLKLYLMSFRSAGAYHEQCVSTILGDLVRLLDPKSITVSGAFGARGGIAFNPLVSYFRPRTDE